MRHFTLLAVVSGSLVLGSCFDHTTQSASEEKAIDEIRAKALAELKNRYPESQKTPVRRDAHAKAHGCVRATFEVDPKLRDVLRVGTFAQPGRRFKVLIRFSNGAFEPGPDTGLDGRGMAVKIIDAEPVEKSPQRGRPPHDILMIDYPIFFSPNVFDYLDFANSGALTGRTEGLRKYFIPDANPFHWRIRQGYIAYKIASQKMLSPLTGQYYSMVPFSFGPGQAVKYSARPCVAASASATEQTSDGPNFLREALRSSLAKSNACFDLLVQLRQGQMAIEDATAEWPESISPFESVGKITIPSQTVSGTRDTDCENLIFNPWHAPNEQRPLGGINRLRKEVYETISNYRTKRNEVIPKDPAVVWDDFR